MNTNLIVYPTDFSECAKNALAYTIAMGKALNCKIKMVHEIEISGITTSEENPNLISETLKVIEEYAEQKLRELKEETESFGLECDYDVLQGRSLYLKDYIENINPLMIVMGTVGKNNIENKLFGSLTAQIIRNSESIVLAIPEKARFNNFSQIVFASDFHTKDKTAIAFIKKITTFFKASLSVIHICEDINNVQQERYKLLKLEHDISRFISTKKLDFELLYGEEAEKELLRHLEKSNPDMLALISRKRNFIERILEKSLSKKMVNQTNIPVLVFPS